MAINAETLAITEITEAEAKLGTPIMPTSATKGLPIASLLPDGSLCWQTRQFNKKKYWKMPLLPSVTEVVIAGADNS